MIALATPSFTPTARKPWDAIAAAHQERILDNLFCTRCSCSVRMVHFTGTVKRGDIRLEGQCATYGHTVIRIVETSGR
jgi:hypothetical protein